VRCASVVREKVQVQSSETTTVTKQENPTYNYLLYMDTTHSNSFQLIQTHSQSLISTHFRGLFYGNALFTQIKPFNTTNINVMSGNSTKVTAVPILDFGAFLFFALLFY